MGPWKKETRFLPKSNLLMVMFGMDNSFLHPNCSKVFNLCFQPCHLKNWEMQVHFKIHGQGKKNLNGDGMAIWYTKERMQKGRKKRTSKHNIYLSGNSYSSSISAVSPFAGPVFGNMDNFTGLGVFVDTYPNEEKHLEVRSHHTTWMLHVAKNKQIGEGECKPCRNAFATF